MMDRFILRALAAAPWLALLCIGLLTVVVLFIQTVSGA